MKIITRLWLGLAILVILSPLGLLLPEHFKAGAAWGEWGKEGIEKLAGYLPLGFEKLSSIWTAPMPDYTLKGGEGNGLPYLSIAYMISAVVGVLIIVAVVLLAGKILIKNNKD